MATIRPDMQLGGYTILSFIGKGGMGEIWLARQTSIGRDVALKILSPKLVAKNPKFAERFIAEAQAAGRLNHPHIIGVHDVGKVEFDGEFIHYFSMEYVDGENFRQIVDRDGPADVEMIAKVMAAMADALSYAHGIGMIHRDIKPENIMITKDGRVKLADFGLAMLVDSEEATEVERDQSGRIKVMGTPLYMSPEQARGRPLDFRSDLYSLGATLFQFLTGRAPYRRNNSKEVMRAHVHDDVPDPADIVDCPESWRQLCMQLLAKKPEDRCADPASFRDLVQAAIAGVNDAPGRRRRVGGRSRKGPGGAVQAVGLLGLVLVIGAVVVFAFTGGDAPPSTDPIATDTGTGTGTGTDQPADLSKRVKAAERFLAGLPKEPNKALTALRGSDGLRNAYFLPADDAMTLLRNRETELVAAIKAADAKLLTAIKAKLNQAEDALRLGDLIAGRTALDAVDKAHRDRVRSTWDGLNTRVEREFDYLAQNAITAIMRSPTPDVIPTKVEETKGKGLSGERLAKVEKAAADRIKQLENEDKARADDERRRRSQQWTEMRRLILAERRSDEQTEPDYRAFVNHLRSFRSRFAGDKWREVIIDRLIVVAEQSEAVDQAVVAMLRKAPYRIELPLGESTTRGSIIDFDRGRFTIAIDYPKGKMVRPVDSADIPVDALIRQACQHASLDAVAEHNAAFAWMWGLDEGPDLLLTEPLAGSHMTKAIAAIDDDIAQAINTVRARYRFARPNQAWLKEFTSKHLSLKEGVLRFEPVALVPFTVIDFRRNGAEVLGALREEHLDSAHWNTPLRAPVDIKMRVVLHDHAKALFGFRQNGRCIRLYGDKRYERTALLLTTKNNGIRFAQAHSEDDRVLEAMDLALQVDDKGQVAFKINGADFGNMDKLTFDPRQPIDLVLQGLYLQDEPIGAIDVLELDITAQRGK
ncbi:MAG: serine/threonine-protein kinase [Planctomycetota bacterium]|jgi:hypothetical protein|nr:serine/threonine-protein kinase [Planctomycetota bacterium]